MNSTNKISHTAQLNKLLAFKKKQLVKTNAIRVVNGAPDGYAGITVDRYHNSFQIQIFDINAEVFAIQIAEEIAPTSDYTVVKWRTERNGASLENFPKSIFKDGNSIVEVYEENAKFKVDLDDAINPGLFLDMRHNRIRLKPFLHNKKVMNGFSYTCSFGLHSRLSGASQVDNVDISQKVLDRGKVNYLLNGLENLNDFHRFDTIEYLQKYQKSNKKYDVIILDPPTFSRVRAKTFKIERDLELLIALALDCLDPNGILLFSTNCASLSEEVLQKRIGRLAKSRDEKLKILFKITQDFDYTYDHHNPTSHLAGFCLQKKVFS